MKPNIKKALKNLGICFCAVLILFVGFLVCYRLFLKDRSNIDLSEYGFVTAYLHDTYGGDYTLNRGRFVQYDKGEAGGMFQYTFHLRDAEGNAYRAEYCRMAPLNADTVSSLTFAPDAG